MDCRDNFGIPMANGGYAEARGQVNKDVSINVFDVCADRLVPNEGVGVGGTDFGRTTGPARGDGGTFPSRKAVNPRTAVRTGDRSA